MLYINDLPEAIKSKVVLFADDLKMIANPFDKEIVEDDLILRSVEIWENTWLLKFNTAKCKVLHFDINSNDTPWVAKRKGINIFKNPL